MDYSIADGGDGDRRTIEVVELAKQALPADDGPS